MGLIKLTERNLPTLKGAPHGKRYHDSEARGLGLTVHDTGRRVFFVTYGHRLKRHRMTLGVWPGLKLEDARKKALKARADWDTGLDPQADVTAKKAEKTFGEWAAEYLEVVTRTKKKPAEDKHYLRLACEKWGGRRLSSITADDITRAVQELEEGGRPATANRFLASVRAMLQAAWRRNLLPANQALKVKAFPEPAPRERFLSDTEQRNFVKAVSAYPDPWIKVAFLMLLSTGARLSEVLACRWEDLDLDGAVWTLRSTKAGRLQRIPLPVGLVPMLRALPRVGDFLVPGRKLDQPRHDLKGPWKDIKEKAKLSNVSLHDLRRTVGREITRTYGLAVASRILRHSDLRTTLRHYSPVEMQEAREALDSYSANLLPFTRPEGQAQLPQGGTAASGEAK